MTFSEIQIKFENDILSEFKFEILEMQYSNYSFGSGYLVYRIKGKNLRLVLDGKEGIIEISISSKGEKYPNVNWQSTYWKKIREVDFKDILRITRVALG